MLKTIILFIVIFNQILLPSVLVVVTNHNKITGNLRRWILGIHLFLIGIIVLVCFVYLGHLWGILFLLLVLIELVTPTPIAGVITSLYGWSVVDLFHRKK